MGTEVTVSTGIDAPAEQVWALIADVTRMGEWSPETRSCRWLGEPGRPEVGARFAGRNRHSGRRWSTVCTIVAAEPGREFAFDVTGAGFLSVATWRYTLRPTPTGCEVEESFTDRRGMALQLFGSVVLGIADRAEHNRRGMVTTLARLKAAAEA
jgi:uncharacterized protein YndB with AHSA1/START domain